MPRGFTLIEVLIAVAVGMVVVGLTWAAFDSMRRSTRHFQALSGLQQEASAIHASIEPRLNGMFHGAQMRLDVRDAGTRNAVVTLDVMCALMERAPLLGRQYPLDPHRSDLVWYRLRWEAGGDHGPPRLLHGYTPYRWKVSVPAARPTGTAPAMVADPYDVSHQVVQWGADDEVRFTFVPGNWFSTYVYPEVRRDRRRDINDNDLRLMPGISPVVYGVSKLEETGTWEHGDGHQLDRALILLSERVSQFRMEVVDFRGFRTIVNPTTGCHPSPEPSVGLSYVDGSGVAVSPSVTIPPYPTVWSSTKRTLDGLWSDGRPDAYPGIAGTPHPQAERPALVRLAFTLCVPMTRRAAPANAGSQDQLLWDRTRSDANTYVTQDVSFSFATSSLGASP